MRKSRTLPKKKSNKIFVLILLIIFFITFIFFTIKIIFLPRFIYINNGKKGTEIIIVDKFTFDSTELIIDNELKLNSARNYGEYKLSNLWILGDKEGYSGQLVLESLIKNLMLPVVYWKDGSNSNLNIYQKIKIALLKSDPNPQIINIPVGDSVKSLFVDSLLVNELPKIKIEDYSGDYRLAEKISAVTEVLGFKTVDFYRGEKKDIDCEIYSKNKYYLNLVSEIFKCNQNIDNNQNFDLLIKVGGLFANRF